MKTVIIKLTLVWTSFIVLSLMFAGISYAKIDPGTIMGLWLFDEGKGDKVEDLSGNGNDGTLANGAKWADGKFKKAVELDGSDDYVDIPDSPTLDGMEEITVAAWIFLHSFAPANYNGFVDKTRGGNPGWRSYNLSQRNGTWEWGLANEANTKNTLNAGTTKEKEWVHLTGTYDGKEMKLYENAVEIGVLAQTGPVQDSDSIVAFGRWNGDGGSLYAEGIIDEVVIFNVALTEDDIKTIMTEGLEKTLAVENTDKLTTTWAAIKQVVFKNKPNILGSGSP